MTSFRTPRSGVAPTARSRGVATLDDALWRRVGAILVARGRLTADELETVLAEQRRTQVPMDEILRRWSSSASSAEQTGSDCGRVSPKLRRPRPRRSPRPWCPSVAR